MYVHIFKCPTNMLHGLCRVATTAIKEPAIDIHHVIEWRFAANEEMMKVLKPMTDLLLDCLPVFEKYNLKLSGMFISAEAICGGFDKCAPTGVVTSKVRLNFS